MRTPTDKQARLLRLIAGGGQGMSWPIRTTGPLVRHGWARAEFDGSYYHFVSITPDGLRALARRLEREETA